MHESNGQETAIRINTMPTRSPHGSVALMNMVPSGISSLRVVRRAARDGSGRRMDSGCALAEKWLVIFFSGRFLQAAANLRQKLRRFLLSIFTSHRAKITKKRAILTELARVFHGPMTVRMQLNSRDLLQFSGDSLGEAEEISGEADGLPLTYSRF